MRYGIYKDGRRTAILIEHTINETKAVSQCEDLARQERGSYCVVQLGVTVPDRIEYVDRFAPKVIYRAEGL